MHLYYLKDLHCRRYFQVLLIQVVAQQGLAEGIRSAKSRNVKDLVDPQPLLLLGLIYEVAKWKSGEQTAIETFTKLKLSKTTFYKLVGKMEV